MTPRSTSATADWQAPPEEHAPAWLITPLRRIEGARPLDGAVAALDNVSGAIFRDRRVEALLRGDWFGHALHPLLTDFPLGSWMSATLLDLFGGSRSRAAATGLVGFGCAMAVPTAVAGVAEWRAAGQSSRRVGVVHATVNGTAASLYLASFVARLLGRHRSGRRLALAGGTAAWVGGYLGGHMSLVRKIGTADPAYGAATPPGPAASADTTP